MKLRTELREQTPLTCDFDALKHDAAWIAWLLFGVYCVIAAIGGSVFCAAMTLPCGYMVGALCNRSTPERPE